MKSILNFHMARLWLIFEIQVWEISTDLVDFEVMGLIQVKTMVHLTRNSLLESKGMCPEQNVG